MNHNSRDDYQHGQKIARLDLLHAWTNHSISHSSTPRHAAEHHYSECIRPKELRAEAQPYRAHEPLAPPVKIVF